MDVASNIVQSIVLLHPFWVVFAVDILLLAATV